MRIRALLIGMLVGLAAIPAVAAKQASITRYGLEGRADVVPQPGVAPKHASITWYGQSFFVVTSATGAKIAFDPYHVQGGIRYSPPSVSANAVFVSHNHFDHNNVDLIKGGDKTVILPITEGTRSGTLQFGREKIPYKSVFSYHDASGGKERGGNTINVVTVDGVRIAHLGDLGTTLTTSQIKQIGYVDILLVPVGGVYTVDAVGASKVVDQLRPRVIIPMHYKTDRVTIPLAGVEPFIKGKKNVVRSGDTYKFFAKGEFADMNPLTKRTIVVLEYLRPHS